MFNVDNITNENNKEHNKKWSILIIRGSGSRKPNALLNDIDVSRMILTKFDCMQKIFK